MAPLDAHQAESQAATALADYIQAQGRAYVAESFLKNLITDEYQKWLNVAITPTDKLLALPERLDTSESWASALAQRPDLKRVNVEGEILALETKLRYNQLFPTLNVFGGYGRNGLDNTIPQSVTFDTNSFTFVTNSARQATLGNALEDIGKNRNPKWNFGALFTVPLSRKSERNRYKAAKESQQQNDAAARLLSQSILQEVDTAIALAKSSYERVGATRQASLFAEMALDAEEKKLQAGTTTQFEVLRLQRDLTAARSDEIRALTDYNRALIEVFFRDGTILDRNKIRVSFR
jgi:HAE1 family hydrophobic/amphiphilic exporter-1